MKHIIRSLSLLAMAAFFSPTAQASDLSAYPDRIQFGRQDINSWSSKTVHIRNNTREVIQMRFIEYGDRSQFRVDTYSCWSLQPLGSCSIQVHYQPYSSGRHQIDIDVSGYFLRIRAEGEAVDPYPPADYLDLEE